MREYRYEKICRLIKVFLYARKEARLRDIVKMLEKAFGKKPDDAYIYRMIKNKLIAKGEVVKEARGRIPIYRLTPEGEKTLTGAEVTRGDIELLLIEVAERLGGELTKISSAKNLSEDVMKILARTFTSFNYLLEIGGDEIFIRVEEGAYIPNHMGRIRSREALQEILEHCIPYLRKLSDEKILLGSIREDARRYRDKKFLLIINGTDPRTLPKELREAINEIARKKQEWILEKTIEMINNLIKQLPKNAEIIFTSNNLEETRTKLEKTIKKMMTLLQ